MNNNSKANDCQLHNGNKKTPTSHQRSRREGIQPCTTAVGNDSDQNKLSGVIRSKFISCL